MEEEVGQTFINFVFSVQGAMCVHYFIYSVWKKWNNEA